MVNDNHTDDINVYFKRGGGNEIGNGVCNTARSVNVTVIPKHYCGRMCQ